MSIINEALKKTENSILQNETKKNASPIKTNAPKSFLLYSLILLLDIFLSSFIFSLLSHKTKIAQTPQKIIPVTPPPAPALPIVPAQPILPLEEPKVVQEVFVLNGIFFSHNDSYALINNQIVRENVMVDGARVLKITENTVELDNQGKPLTLTSGR
jgi:hypothetical protein